MQDNYQDQQSNEDYTFEFNFQNNSPQDQSVVINLNSDLLQQLKQLYEENQNLKQHNQDQQQKLNLQNEFIMQIIDEQKQQEEEKQRMGELQEYSMIKYVQSPPMSDRYDYSLNRSQSLQNNNQQLNYNLEEDKEVLQIKDDYYQQSQYEEQVQEIKKQLHKMHRKCESVENEKLSLFHQNYNLQHKLFDFEKQLNQKRSQLQILQHLSKPHSIHSTKQISEQNSQENDEQENLNDISLHSENIVNESQANQEIENLKMEKNQILEKLNESTLEKENYIQIIKQQEEIVLALEQKSLIRYKDLKYLLNEVLEYHTNIKASINKNGQVQIFTDNECLLEAPLENHDQIKSTNNLGSEEGERSSRKSIGSFQCRDFNDGKSSICSNHQNNQQQQNQKQKKKIKEAKLRFNQIFQVLQSQSIRKTENMKGAKIIYKNQTNNYFFNNNDLKHSAKTPNLQKHKSALVKFSSKSHKNSEYNSHRNSFEKCVDSNNQTPKNSDDQENTLACSFSPFDRTDQQYYPYQNFESYEDSNKETTKQTEMQSFQQVQHKKEEETQQSYNNQIQNDQNQNNCNNNNNHQEINFSNDNKKEQDQKDHQNNLNNSLNYDKLYYPKLQNDQKRDCNCNIF